MKLIQINGWLGRLNGPLARFIEEESPDIVCLQETFAPGTKVLPSFKDQYGYIDELIEFGGFKDLFFAPSWAFELGGETIETGLTILSKYKLSDKKHFHTSGEYAVRTLANYPAEGAMNARVFQSCTAKLPNAGLYVANHQGYLAGTHARGNETSAEMMKKVRDALAGLPHPLIFCGDLNVGPNTPTLDVLNDLNLRNLTLESGVKTTLSSAHRAPTQDRSSVICDYIFVSKDIKVSKFSVSEEIVSDHKALILEFEI